MGQIKRFLDWLYNKPALSPSTIKVYRKAIVGLLAFTETANPTIEQINKYIAIKCNKRQAHVKYAIKHYLEFIGRKDDYDKLNKAKIRKPIRQKTFINKEVRSKIIARIENQQHKNIAMLQEVSAARAREIISIQKHRVKRLEDGTVEIMLKGKGDKPRPIYLNSDYYYILKPYMTVAPRAYLFLEPGTEYLTEIQQETKIESVYKRYLEDVKKAAAATGYPSLTTHDFRRSKADEIEQKHGVRKAQLILGHSTIRTTEIYLNRDKDTIRRVMLDEQGS